MSDSHSDALVLFGATGDLAYKKILPALQAMVKRGHLNVPVVGVTLTNPMLNRPRQVLWVATGMDKAEMLVRLSDGDRSNPAGRVQRQDALLLADGAAAGQLAADYNLGE